MFGDIPAYGFFIRHVKGLEVSNVDVSFLKEDLRPPFVMSDVSDVDFQHVKAQRAPNVPSFALTNVTGFQIHQTGGLPDTQKDRVEHGAL